MSLWGEASCHGVFFASFLVLAAVAVLLAAAPSASRLHAQKVEAKAGVTGVAPMPGAAQSVPSTGPNQHAMPPGAAGKTPPGAGAKPGETPGKAAEKKPDGPKPITRPTKPATPPDPDELKVLPDADGQGPAELQRPAVAGACWSGWPTSPA